MEVDFEVTEDTMKRLRYAEHAERWAPVGTQAAKREVVSDDVCLGGVILEFPRRESSGYSERRLIVGPDGRVLRRGALMDNTPEQAMQIPAYIRRATCKANS